MLGKVPFVLNLIYHELAHLKTARNTDRYRAVSFYIRGIKNHFELTYLGKAEIVLFKYYLLFKHIVTSNLIILFS